MAQTTERSRGQLLVGAGGVVAAIGSLASFPLLVAASSSAAPGNYLGVVLALVLGGVLGSLVAARGFVHLAVGSPLRVALLALVVGISGLAAPWIIAVVTGAVGYRSVA